MNIQDLTKLLKKYNQTAVIKVADYYLNYVEIKPEDIEIMVDSSFGNPVLVIKTKFVSKP